MEEYDKIKKTKRNKHKTACIDQRRQLGHCMICGGETINETIFHCSKCNTEELEITERYTWYLDDFYCSCGKRMNQIYVIEHCISCGATSRTICPSCKRNLCWSNGKNKSCKCGYRI